MPDLQLQLAITTAKAVFSGFNIQLQAQPGPVQQVNTGPRLNFGLLSQGPAAQPMACPPALFRSASVLSQDVNNQAAMDNYYGNLITQALTAVAAGFHGYRASAGLLGVTINGALANGGRLTRSNIAGNIVLSSALTTVDVPGRVAVFAVAQGFDQQWNLLADSVRVPGLFWYPSFLAVSAAQAPLTNNLPTTFSSLQHNPIPCYGPGLSGAMKNFFGSGGGIIVQDYRLKAIEAIAEGISAALNIWKLQQVVMCVQGSGPVPAYQPPRCSSGSVVGGQIVSGNHIAL